MTNPHPLPKHRFALLIPLLTALLAVGTTLRVGAQPAAPDAPAAPAATVASPPASQPAADDDGSDRPRRREQAPVGPGGPTPRLADGKPDFTGLWRPVREKGKPGGNIGKDEPGFKLPFSPAGEKAFEYNQTKTIDPEALCILGGLPRHDASGLQFEIIQHTRRIVFLYVYTTHRIVQIGGRKHDPDPDPHYFGDEVSDWDGDTLVIDSVGFKDSKDGKFWIDENGDPESASTHVIERWNRPDLNHIHLELTVDDPVYYTRPFHFTRTWVLGKQDQDLEEYACNENNLEVGNIGPGPGGIGANGNRGAGYGKLPATPPPPWFYDKPAAAPKAP